DVIADLVQRHASIQAPQCERKAGARGRERLEAERRQNLGGAGIPRVGDDERLVRVQRPEGGGFLLLGHRDIGTLRCLTCVATSAHFTTSNRLPPKTRSTRRRSSTSAR